jgi:glycosyltransferase involved in cell wall biosynthesis
VAWAKVAAHFAFIRHPGFYVNPWLENLLIEVAQKIEKEPLNLCQEFNTKKSVSGKRRVLHVVTESYGTGGHSQFITRWVNNTLDDSVHSLVTTAQRGELPDNLVDAIRNSGGWYESLLEKSSDFVEQALALRSLTRAWADIVVLFTHPFDPLPLVAFGVDGGPPVLLCNHADHAFWLGSKTADVILDYHPSARNLTLIRRGHRNSVILPIPLTRIKSSNKKTELRRTLGFKDTDVVMLTIGRDEKFFPHDGFDYFKVMVDVLKKHPNVVLTVVGPEPLGKWVKASIAVDGRIHVLGTISRLKLEVYYDAADLYVQSFPCGSGTSFFEAGLHGLPLFALHVNGLPHFSGVDDIAFKEVSVHYTSIGDFTEALDAMIADPSAFRQKAAVVKSNLELEHCSPHWNRHLEGILETLPSKHTINEFAPVSEELDYADVFWANMSSYMMFNELPENSFSRLVRTYAQTLPRDEQLNAQAKCLMTSFIKVDSFKRSKQFTRSFSEFINSALTHS